ncbi:MAG: hypothetical protein AB7G06_09205 [Bdellovibrionales bacterium]
MAKDTGTTTKIGKMVLGAFGAMAKLTRKAADESRGTESASKRSVDALARGNALAHRLPNAMATRFLEIGARLTHGLAGLRAAPVPGPAPAPAATLTATASPAPGGTQTKTAPVRRTAAPRLNPDLMPKPSADFIKKFGDPEES